MQLYNALNEFIDRDIMPLGASMNIKNQFIHCKTQDARRGKILYPQRCGENDRLGGRKRRD